jgi:pimeloyl-ACP methyl ester carboxylesterase
MNYTNSIICLLLTYMVSKKILEYINKSIIFRPHVISNKYSLDDIKYKFKMVYNLENKEQIKEYWIKIDNAVLHALLIQTIDTKLNDNLVIFFHGNAGNIIDSYIPYEFLSKFGSVLVFDYRGYGMSSGTYSEKNIYDDANKVWKYATTKLNYKPKNITLVGLSLGCSVTYNLTEYLTNNNIYPRCLICINGFYSMSELVNELSSISSMSSILQCLLVYDFDNAKSVGNICSNSKIPIFLLHAKEDTLISNEHSKKLKEISKNCHFIEVDGDHNNFIISDGVYDKIIKLIN